MVCFILLLEDVLSIIPFRRLGFLLLAGTTAMFFASPARATVFTVTGAYTNFAPLGISGIIDIDTTTGSILAFKIAAAGTPTNDENSHPAPPLTFDSSAGFTSVFSDPSHITPLATCNGSRILLQTNPNNAPVLVLLLQGITTLTGLTSTSIGSVQCNGIGGTFSFSSGYDGNNTTSSFDDKLTGTLTPVAPPTLTKAFADSQVELFFGTTALSFTLTNPNTIPLTGLAFTDTLPSGLIVSTPNGLTGSCGGGTITAATGSNGISLSGATLAAGASCIFSVNVTGTAIGVFTNTTSTVTSNEAAPGSAATATTSVNDLFFYGFFAESGGGHP